MKTCHNIRFSIKNFENNYNTQDRSKFEVKVHFKIIHHVISGSDETNELKFAFFI